MVMWLHIPIMYQNSLKLLRRKQVGSENETLKQLLFFKGLHFHFPSFGFLIISAIPDSKYYPIHSKNMNKIRSYVLLHLQRILLISSHEVLMIIMVTVHRSDGTNVY